MKLTKYVKNGMFKPLCMMNYVMHVKYADLEAIEITYKNDVATPYIMSWICIISQTFFVQSRLCNLISSLSYQ